MCVYILFVTFLYKIEETEKESKVNQNQLWLPQKLKKVSIEQMGSKIISLANVAACCCWCCYYTINYIMKEPR